MKRRPDLVRGVAVHKAEHVLAPRAKWCHAN